MIELIPAERRHVRDFGWLKTYWLFSFDDYHDPHNLKFSSLRVFNDDIIAPHSGFPLHAHKEMEIVTVMLAGELTHEDSLGNRATIRAGDIQRMTAGRGIRHSEFNHGDAPVHLYQLWFEPRTPGLRSDFQEYNFLDSAGGSSFQALVSGCEEIQAPLQINADVVVYRHVFGPGETMIRPCQRRSLFCYLTAGSLVVRGATVEAGDQLRITEEDQIKCESMTAGSGLWIDLPS